MGKRHGWFALAGVQTGDRTVEEQMLGLAPAIEAAKGKTVLDLGAAEGLIAREFARGARGVTCVELLSDHCRVAREVCKGLPVLIIESELADYIARNSHPVVQFDVVLALGIAHKLHDPGSCIRFAAQSARELLVFRGPGKEKFWDGWLKSKFRKDGVTDQVHVPTTLAELGFVEGETLESAHGERAQYWHRKA